MNYYSTMNDYSTYPILKYTKSYRIDESIPMETWGPGPTMGMGNIMTVELEFDMMEFEKLNQDFRKINDDNNRKIRRLSGILDEIDKVIEQC